MSKHNKHKLSSTISKRNDISGSLDYVNKRFCIGIDYLGFDHVTEDAKACILFDLANLPLDMVVRRLQSEGATVF